MTKKYKVEFKQIETFVFDTLAENEDEAIKLTRVMFDEAIENGTAHYHQILSCEPETEIGNIYDVSNTDDDFTLPTYQERIKQLEFLGIPTSDAQSVADVELNKGLIIK